MGEEENTGEQGGDTADGKGGSRLRRRLQSRSSSKSKTKSSTMCGCGNEWMQVDCDMYQNKECRVSNQQSQSSSENGIQAGAGPKFSFDNSKTVTANNQACDAALKAFSSEDRQQTCVGPKSGEHVSASVPSRVLWK